MKRFLSLSLIGIFSVSILDVPPATSDQTKSCCCTVKGHHCKFAKHLSCPLESHADESKTKAVLDPFGCGSREEHATSPSYSKEFCNDISAAGYFFELPNFLIKQPALKFTFLFSGRIERPPITPHFF